MKYIVLTMVEARNVREAIRKARYSEPTEVYTDQKKWDEQNYSGKGSSIGFTKRDTHLST